MVLKLTAGRASISIRTFSPANTIMKPPGIDCVEFGAYRSTEPRSTILFTFLYFSPPWATRAARARSIGVVVLVIAIAATGAAPVAGAAVVTVWPKPETANTNTKEISESERDNVLFIGVVLFSFLKE